MVTATRKDKIQIKTIFGGWNEVNKDQARRWAKHQIDGITTMDFEDRIKHINTRLVGATVTELLSNDELRQPPKAINQNKI